MGGKNRRNGNRGDTPRESREAQPEQMLPEEAVRRDESAAEDSKVGQVHAAEEDRSGHCGHGCDLPNISHLHICRTSAFLTSSYAQAVVHSVKSPTHIRTDNRDGQVSQVPGEAWASAQARDKALATTLVERPKAPGWLREAWIPGGINAVRRFAIELYDYLEASEVAHAERYRCQSDQLQNVKQAHLQTESLLNQARNQLQHAKADLSAKSRELQRFASDAMLLKASQNSQVESETEIQHLKDQVRQLEAAAAFNKIEDSNVDVPTRLDAILARADELPELVRCRVLPHILDRCVRAADSQQGAPAAKTASLRGMAERLKAKVDSFLHYAIQILLLNYIKENIWDHYHPAACEVIRRLPKPRGLAVSLGQVYEVICRTENHLKASNWRMLSCKALWSIYAEEIGGDASQAISHMATQLSEHFCSKILQPWMDGAIGFRLQEADQEEVQGEVERILCDVLKVKLEAGTLDARYEYLLVLPDLPNPVNESGDQQEITADFPIAVKTPEYSRIQASEDSQMQRVRISYKNATYHTAGDAGWVPTKGRHGQKP